MDRVTPPTAMLILAAVVLAVFSLTAPEQNTLDLHLHDTYFIVALPHVFLTLAALATGLAVCHWLTQRLLPWQALAYLHAGLLSGSLLSAGIMWLLRSHLPRQFVDLRGSWHYVFEGVISFPTFLAIFIFGILLYLLHLIFGLIKLVKGKESV